MPEFGNGFPERAGELVAQLVDALTQLIFKAGGSFRHGAIKAINGAAILLFRDPAVRDRLGTEDV